MPLSTPTLHHLPCTLPNREELRHMGSFAGMGGKDGSFGDSPAALTEREKRKRRQERQSMVGNHGLSPYIMLSGI